MSELAIQIGDMRLMLAMKRGDSVTIEAEERHTDYDDPSVVRRHPLKIVVRRVGDEYLLDDPTPR